MLGLYGNDNDMEQHDHQNIMIERLLKLYDDAFNFPDHVFMVIYRLTRRFILTLIDVLRPALERSTCRHGALSVIVQITNALCFFTESEDADLSLTLQPSGTF